MGFILDRKDKSSDAIHYYELAVAQNHTMAKYRLANLYNRNNDTDNARIYYKMAADDGVKEAKNNLAGILFEDKNYKEAGLYYKQAIAQGCYNSAENMGDLCRTLKEYDIAINYYKMIPDNINCQIKLANIYEKLNDLDNMIDWYKKAADHGDIESCFKLASIYEKTGNEKKAIRYYQIASDHGHQIAKLYAGRLYFMQTNYEEAKAYLEEPAKLNNIYALNTLAIMYDNFFKDPKKAIEYYEKAIMLNCTEAMYNLAQLMFRSFEYDKAEKYLKMGAENGNKRCEYFLAAFYYRKSIDMFK